MAHHHQDKKKGGSGSARLLGSSIAGGVELIFFHPVDTATKRLMAYEGRIFAPGTTFAQGQQNLWKVILRDAYGKGGVTAFSSLFPGFGWGLMYKIGQRTYKFGFQPVVKDAVHKHWGPLMSQYLGPKGGHTLSEALAGCAIGVGEIVLLPLDVLKIKKQTNPGAFASGIFSGGIAGLYKGALTTATRNAFGSFSLFGANGLVKHYWAGSKEKGASLATMVAGSTMGAVASIVVASPFDVVKTRLQKGDFSSDLKARKVFREVLVKEGAGAFFKGLTPKVLAAGPKLTFSFTLAQYLIAFFEQKLDAKNAA